MRTYKYTQIRYARIKHSRVDFFRNIYDGLMFRLKGSSTRQFSIMYRVSGHTSQPYEVNIMRGCVISDVTHWIAQSYTQYRTYTRTYDCPKCKKIDYVAYIRIICTKLVQRVQFIIVPQFYLFCLFFIRKAGIYFYLSLCVLDLGARSNCVQQVPTYRTYRTYVRTLSLHKSFFDL